MKQQQPGASVTGGGCGLTNGVPAKAAALATAAGASSATLPPPREYSLDTSESVNSHSLPPPVPPPRCTSPEPTGAVCQSRKRSRHSPSYARRATVAWGAPFARLSRQVSIDRLPEEGRRIEGVALPRLAQRRDSVCDEGPLNSILRTLLRPDDWAAPHHGRFPIGLRTIQWLCAEATAILAAESTVLDLRAPVKVFGDIHGQYADLMRLFREYGAPSHDDHFMGGAGLGGPAARPVLQERGQGGAQGDLMYTDYLFLGDYVDRGAHSLETICLLLALKVKNPTRVFLLRGNHELPEVNSRDGFLYECRTRLESDAAGCEAWKAFNALFEWLPLAATINNVILCLHGGVGGSLNHVEQLRRLQRPLRMDPDDPHASVLLDCLWSDPTEHDSIEGVHPNTERGDPVVRYGPDRVRSFLRLNGLKLLVRGHECVMDGFQRFAGGALLTLFSATNYCGVCENAGALLIIGKELECIPKLIYPVAELEDAWLRSDQFRPATPPREREGEEKLPEGFLAEVPDEDLGEDEEVEALAAGAQAGAGAGGRVGGGCECVQVHGQGTDHCGVTRSAEDPRLEQRGEDGGAALYTHLALAPPPVRARGAPTQPPRAAAVAAASAPSVPSGGIDSDRDALLCGEEGLGDDDLGAADEDLGPAEGEASLPATAGQPLTDALRHGAPRGGSGAPLGPSASMPAPAALRLGAPSESQHELPGARAPSPPPSNHHQGALSLPLLQAGDGQSRAAPADSLRLAAVHRRHSLGAESDDTVPDSSQDAAPDNDENMAPPPVALSTRRLAGAGAFAPGDTDAPSSPSAPPQPDDGSTPPRASPGSARVAGGGRDSPGTPPRAAEPPLLFQPVPVRSQLGLAACARMQRPPTPPREARYLTRGHRGDSLTE